MNDRIRALGTLPTWADESKIDSNDPNSYQPFVDEGDDIEDGSIEMPSRQNKMDQFYGDVEVVKSNINTVVNATSAIEDLNEKLLLSNSEQQEKELAFQLKSIVDVANKSAKQAKEYLTQLKKENDDLENEKKLNESDIRVRRNICSTLLRKFVDEVKKYQNAQFKYKADLKNRAKRQIKIFKPDVTEEEVNEIMQSGGRQQYFKKQIIAGGVNDDIKTMHAQVSGKAEDVSHIEASMKELHQMFLDMALLTEQQGELLDQISFNVANAVDYTAEGNDELDEGLVYAKEARKKQMMMVGIIVLVIIILFAILF